VPVLEVVVTDVAEMVVVVDVVTDVADPVPVLCVDVDVLSVRLVPVLEVNDVFELVPVL